MTGARSLPAGPLLCWYGDDFTGSSAVMEAMSAAGLPAVLFFDVPTPEQRARFADHRGIGMAGVARAQTPAWMRDNLPRFYRAMAESGAPVALYKICSTLDSSPEVGSIGAAVEVATPYLGDWIPFLTAAPAIGRYQLFGNLFARANENIYRLDRHPTMSRHPVTPMHEADVRIHLGKQTSMEIGLVDYVSLQSGQGAQALAAQLAAGKRIIALDAVDEDSLADAGELIWERRGKRIFAVGSQGVAYALAAYFRRAGMLSAAPPPVSAAGPRQIAAVSGSCSPMTGAQIEWAGQHGFTLIRVDVCKAVDALSWQAELDRVGAAAGAALERGENPLLFTANGAEDSAIAAFRVAVAAAGLDLIAANETVSKGLGRVLNTLVRENGVRRVAIAGGDTSSYATQALDIYAITLLAATIPGAALFRAYSNDPALDGLEIALKGGQMGAIDYFDQISRGGISAR